MVTNLWQSMATNLYGSRDFSSLLETPEFLLAGLPDWHRQGPFYTCRTDKDSIRQGSKRKVGNHLGVRMKGLCWLVKVAPLVLVVTWYPL